MTDKPPIHWDNDHRLLGEWLHTAFRKGVENQASVIVWNAIYLLEPEAWWQIIHRIATTRGPLKDRLIEDRREQSTWWDKPRGAAPTLFFFGLESMDMEDRDWKSVESYLDYGKPHMDNPDIVEWDDDNARSNETES